MCRMHASLTLDREGSPLSHLISALYAEYGVGDLIVGQNAELRKELIDVQRLTIRNVAAEPEMDAAFFQRVVGGCFSSLRS